MHTASPQLNSSGYVAKADQAARRGMSLIELVGALAIIAILAGVVSINAVRKIEEEKRQAEAQTMERIGRAFEQVVIHYKSLPAATLASWAPQVASEMGVPIDLVWTNGVGTPRLLLYDPSLVVAGLTPASFPYHQQAQGATTLTNARLVILSSLQPGYPDVALNTAAAFSNLWNRVPHQLPAGWPADWAPDPDDLVIQRVDLSRLFHRVVLNNVDGWEAAQYVVLTNSLSGTNHYNALAVGSAPLATYLIHGTPIRLYYSSGLPQAMDVINADASYAFESGRWNRHPQDGLQGSTTCGPLGQWVERFMKRTDWPGLNGTTPEAVVLGMYDMLWSMTDWANAGFEVGNGTANKWEPPSARFVFDVAPQLIISSDNLIENP